MIYAVNNVTKEHVVFVDFDSLPNGSWTKIKADADGWIQFSGYECPIDYNAVCDIQFNWNAGEKRYAVPMNTPMEWGKIKAYRPILEPQKQVKEWDGVGFPNNGVECEALILSESAHKDWVAGVSEGMVRLPNGRFGCIFKTSTCRYMVGAQDEFRPIRTDRDRWVESAMQAASCPDTAPLVRSYFEAIYDADLAKLPDADSNNHRELLKTILNLGDWYETALEIDTHNRRHGLDGPKVKKMIEDAIGEKQEEV